MGRAMKQDRYTIKVFKKGEFVTKLTDLDAATAFDILEKTPYVTNGKYFIAAYRNGERYGSFTSNQIPQEYS